MNRAPVALFALLCTLASSMVAAGVANDRSATAVEPTARLAEKAVLTTISFSASPLETWQTEPNWKAIDIERAVALPTKKIPTRIPEKVKPVTAIIITIEQAATAAAKPAVAKPIAQTPIVAKPAAPKSIAVQKAAAQKPVVKPEPRQVEAAKAAVMSVVSKMVAASRAAPIQPRVSSSYTAAYAPTATARGVLSNGGITLADLHLCHTGIITTDGRVTALPVEQLAKNTGNVSKVTLDGGRLQIAYGSLSMISVGGTSFTASPYIADNASSILVNQGLSTASNVKSTAKSGKNAGGLSIWSWGGADIMQLQGRLSQTFQAVGEHLENQVQHAATGYINQVQTFTVNYWFPMLNTDYNSTIKSAQKPSVTK